MPPLDRFLVHLGLSVEPFAICRVGRGFRVEMAGARQVTLHYVIRGVGTVEAAGRSYAIGPASLVLVPAGVKHRVEPTHQESVVDVDFLDVACGPTSLGLAAHEAGDGHGVVLTCGRILATYGDAIGLFDSLDAPLVEDFTGNGAVEGLFAALVEEQDSASPGGRRMVELLMEQALIHLFRRIDEREGGPVPWLSALQEPGLARVLEAVLADPAAAHSLESLAKLASMSRTVFSERFKAAFGRTAVGFVKETRLQRAAQLLRTSDLPVKAIALEVGFASRSHFSRAFKERFGREPARFRSDLED